MSELEHPETIIIKNKFYPSGLTEGQVWDYYQKNKQHMLNEVRDRDILLWIAVDDNVVLKRKIDNNHIKLTNSNFDEIIHGRVISIHNAMNFYENICIIDIDCDSWERVRKATIDIYESAMKLPFINKLDVRYNGKNGFHFKCHLSRKSKIHTIKFLLEHHFKNDITLSQYTISHKRTPGVPNIDLSPNNVKGSFIALNSLSVIGLKCMEVEYNNILSFNPSTKATIK